MTHADNAPVPAGQSVSLAIIGGGVMGLFAALVAGERGVETMVLDAGALGQGASHGLIGALMPHTPDRWSEKKQFQFDALTGLEPVLRRLEEKGYVTHTVEGRTFHFRAAEKRGTVAAKAVQQIMDWFTGGSLEEVLVGLVDNKRLDPKQLQALSEKIARAKKK